jgi:hypothetical protein
MYYGSGLGGLLLLALDIYCIYLIVTDRGADTNKLLWIIIVLLLPLIGPLLYLFVGRGRAAL